MDIRETREQLNNLYAINFMPYYKRITAQYWALYKETIIREIKEGRRTNIMEESKKTPYKRDIILRVNKEKKGLEIYADNQLTLTELEYIKGLNFKWSYNYYIFWRKYDKDIIKKLKDYFNKEDVNFIIDNKSNIKLKTKSELEQAILKLLEDNKGDISREAIISILKDSNPKII